MENPSIGAFLEAAIAWAEDSEFGANQGLTAEEPWKQFAAFLYCGRLPGYAGLYGFCHVPIDNIVLNSSEFEGLAQFCEAWSRITRYSDYFAFQVAVRKRFPSSPPLAVEFRVWQRNNAP